MHSSFSIAKPALAGGNRLLYLSTQRQAVNGSLLCNGICVAPQSFTRAPQSKLGTRPSHLDGATVRAAQAPVTKKNLKNRPKPQKNTPTIDNDMWSTLFSRLAKAAAICALAVGVALWGARPAEAARSGGRMGGSAFGGRSSYYVGSSFGSSLGSSSSFGRSSRSAFAGSSFGARSSAGLLTTPYRSSTTLNSFFFSPFGFGFGYGYPMGGGFSSLFFWAVFAIIMVQVVNGVLNKGGYAGELDSGERLSVAKVQVGLLGSARELQRDLKCIADSADTSSSRGLHYVLQETVLALMRNPDYCIYGFAKSGVENSADEAEARFNKLSLEERGKFEKETRVNVGGRTARGSLNIETDLTTPVNELIVVTILVACEGRLKLPKVSSRSELIEALTSLGAVPASDVLALEVLWTPEEENDYFTQEDLATDYQLLNTL